MADGVYSRACWIGEAIEGADEGQESHLKERRSGDDVIGERDEKCRATEHALRCGKATDVPAATGHPLARTLHCHEEGAQTTYKRQLL